MISQNLYKKNGVENHQVLGDLSDLEKMAFLILGFSINNLIGVKSILTEYRNEKWNVSRDEIF